MLHGSPLHLLVWLDMRLRLSSELCEALLRLYVGAQELGGFRS